VQLSNATWQSSANGAWRSIPAGAADARRCCQALYLIRSAIDWDPTAVVSVTHISNRRWNDPHGSTNPAAGLSAREAAIDACLCFWGWVLMENLMGKFDRLNVDGATRRASDYAQEVAAALSERHASRPQPITPTDRDRRWCLFTSAGDKNNIHLWLRDKVSRKWDLVIAYYGDSDQTFSKLSKICFYAFAQRARNSRI